MGFPRRRRSDGRYQCLCVNRWFSEQTIQCPRARLPPPRRFVERQHHHVTDNSVSAPKVSILTACYNAEQYLGDAIASVLEQTMDDLEFVIVDDASTDGSLRIAHRYARMDSRVRVLSLTTNVGAAGARNVGIQAARGDWVANLDADDIALPRRIEEQLNVVENRNAIVMVGSGSVSIDASGREMLEHKYPTTHRNLVRALRSLRAFPPHSSVIYRRDALAQVSGFNSRYPPSEDYDLWLRLSELGELAAVGKPLVKIRRHAASISNSEGGLSQLRMGIAATTCHFLRIHGEADPSASVDDAVWRGFLAWIETQMTQERVLERYRSWETARAEYLSTPGTGRRLHRLARRVIQSGAATRLIRERLFGSDLPERLAMRWARISPTPRSDRGPAQQ
jgi:hypothetical protein